MPYVDGMGSIICRCLSEMRTDILVSSQVTTDSLLGGGFKLFLFSTLLGEMIQFD